MNTEDLKLKFRTQFTRVHLFAVVAATLVEINAYILYIHSGKYPLSLTCPYLWHSLIIPAAINFGAHIIARIIAQNTLTPRSFSAFLISGGRDITSHKESLDYLKDLGFVV